MTTPEAEGPDPAVPAAESEGESVIAIGPESSPIAVPGVWVEEPPPPPAPAGPSLLVSMSAALLLIGAIVCVITFFAVRAPAHQVAGSAVPGAAAGRPESVVGQPPSATSEPPVTTTTTRREVPAEAIPPDEQPAPPTNLLSALSVHPLSTSDATMAPATCALSRFDPADDRQDAFFQQAKTCADAAWHEVLAAAGLPAPAIGVVIVRNGPVNTWCGTVNPTDRPTECHATVYMTPAYLRDIEHDGRFPGRYFGVFLREYGKAVQDATGLTALYTAARSQPGAPTVNLDNRFAQQATCLAGVMSGAMSGLGAVDTNITNEIRDRLSTVDAPPDAAAWLAKGFQSRQLSSCNSWA